MIGSPGNPWVAKLEQYEFHLKPDPKAVALFNDVAADPNEEVLASFGCARSTTSRGHLVITTTWLYWVQKRPKRHEFWPLDIAFNVEGVMAGTKLWLSDGTGFMPPNTFAGKKLKTFGEYLGVVQRAANWELNNAEPAQPAQQAGASIPEQIAQLASLRDQGVITAADFDAKKADLLDRM